MAAGHHPMSAPIIIVGAGQAGVRVAETLRKLGYDGRLLLIGEEPHPPYQRPPLSKKFLLGEMSEQQLWLTGDGFFIQNGIELMVDTLVTGLDLRGKRVLTQGGGELDYRTLVLATGSHARKLPVPGAGLKGVHTLRTIADVRHLREAVAGARRIAIIGGGYIGLEVAAVMREQGKEVIVLEGEERLLKRVMSPIMAEFFLKLHLKHGAEVRLGEKVVGLIGREHVSAVALDHGEQIAADLVLVAIGGLATDAIAAAAGLPCGDGIIVDEHGMAAPDVYACGDCARFPSRRYGRVVRLESVQNANDQARAVAQAIAGTPEIYDPVPWFWSDQYDVKLQIAGLAQGYDRHALDGDQGSGSFSVSYFQGERLLAVDAVNSPRAHMLARRQLAGGRAG
jgi:3-phenylpropionate/trans-cinnamate dioxygenase ferredoxin reductase subunit